MKYAEFRRHLGKAGLSINEFAALIESHPNSISNYAKKDAVPTVYAALAVLMGDAADRGLNFRDVLSRFGVRGQTRSRAADGNIARIDEYRSKPKINNP